MTTFGRFFKGALIAACALTAIGAAAQQPRKLTYATFYGSSEFYEMSAKYFMDEVAKRTQGKVTFQPYYGGTLLKTAEMSTGLAKGAADMAAAVPAAFNPREFPLTGVVMPFISENPIAVTYAFRDLVNTTPELQEEYRRNNQKLLWALGSGENSLWTNKPIHTAADLKGLKYRTVGLAADLNQAMGLAVAQIPGGEIVPAMERGVIDAFEYNNPTADRRFGAQNVAKNYMLGSYHQATEYFEIMFNKTKFNSLPKEHQAILQYAAEAASSANYWYAMDLYSKDLQELKDKDKVNIIRTPKDIFEAQIKAWDGLIEQLGKDPYMKKVMDSQKAWAKRVVYYETLNAADYVTAYEHHFGKMQG